MLAVQWQEDSLATRAHEKLLPPSFVFLLQVHVLVHVVLSSSHCMLAPVRKLKREYHTILLL